MIGPSAILDDQMPIGRGERKRGLDSKFMRRQRLLPLRQELTGTKRNFGTFGFVEEKHVSYLIVPKSLGEFVSKRIVGIKYESLHQADVTITRVPINKHRDPTGRQIVFGSFSNASGISPA
jgi:hypothetical protein